MEWNYPQLLINKISGSYHGISRLPNCTVYGRILVLKVDAYFKLGRARALSLCKFHNNKKVVIMTVYCWVVVLLRQNLDIFKQSMQWCYTYSFCRTSMTSIRFFNSKYVPNYVNQSIQVVTNSIGIYISIIQYQTKRSTQTGPLSKCHSHFILKFLFTSFYNTS